MSYMNDTVANRVHALDVCGTVTPDMIPGRSLENVARRVSALQLRWAYALIVVRVV
jgi:hypothetical protein